MAEDIVSHYRIISRLGTGGMGVVYRAEDIKLRRTVALKFLPPSFSSDTESKKRLIHEAQSASSLDHPNICTIHEIGETDDGKLFISMPCYEGETLKDKITKGPIESSEAVNIILQICEGLEKAHKNDIVHRDIKPANIFITTDGIVKILDFGLAKSKGQTQLTKMGTTLGTIDYMSPEQATGGIIDKRTDIWSTGVLFYEMLTGQLPFKGEYEQAVIYSILNTEPESDNIPKELVSVINKAINKSPKKRYQNSKEMIIDLESLRDGSKSRMGPFSLRLVKRLSLKTRIMTAVVLVIATALILYFNLFKTSKNSITTHKRKMIVVLPFENLGPPEDDYFAEGVRDEISNKLSSLASIGVISRNSAEKYARSNKSSKEIGKELGVDYILEGSIRWAKNKDKESRVRIIPQLVRVSDDVSIWSESFDKVINDIFDVQNEIARNVVDNLGIKLLPGQKVTGPPPTKNLDAYDYYLKANQMKYRKSSKADVYASIRLYEKAIELDSNFAAAYAQLSISYMGVYDRFYDRSNSILEKIKINLQKAAQLDSNSADVHLARAFYYGMIKNDEDRELTEFNKTLEIQPNNAEVFMSLSIYYNYKGRLDLDLKYSLKAFSLDPLASRYAGNIGLAYDWQRDYKNGAKYLNRAIELSPDMADYYVRLIYIYLQWKGNTNEAWKVYERLKSKKPEESQWVLNELNTYDRNFKEAIKNLEHFKPKNLNDEITVLGNSLRIALVYDYMHEYNLARKYFNLLKVQTEKNLAAKPDDYRFLKYLGMANAGLNKKEEALKEIKKYYEINLSLGTSAKEYSKKLDLAMVYMLVGDYENALKQIDSILSKPGYFSVNMLKLDPLYDPLRKLTEYNTIIKKYSNNTF